MEMNMITKLTKEQEQQMPVCVEKWLKIGLSMERLDRKAISEYTPKLQKFLNRKNNLSLIIMNNPFYTWLAILLLRNQVWNQVGNQVEKQVGKQVENQVWKQVRNQVWNQVGKQVENQVGKQVEDFIWPYLDGNFASGYFSFYDYMFENVLKIEHEYQEFWEVYKMSSQFSLIYPLENFIVFCEKPIKINIKNSILHCDNAPAIQYADDFNIYCLNGVKVTKEIVETSAYDLDPKLVLTEKNAEVRREIVRKIGIERICQKLKTKTIDKWNEYELLELPKIEGMTIKPIYLKMRNPSIGVYHLEGVPPEIKTCKQALAWRCGEVDYIEPIQLT